MYASSAIPGVWTPRILSVLRIVAGFLFMTHGSAKILHFPDVQNLDHLRVFSLIGVAGLLELIGGTLVMIGLFTRAAAFVLSGEMAFAYFIAHAPTNFLPLLNHGESAVLYCFLFLYLAFAGPGPWSIDVLLRRARKASRA
jgi:putative oxidoreductase